MLTEKLQLSCFVHLLFFQAVRKGLVNEWADYKRERDWRADPWYDDGGAAAAATITVKTVRDAYKPYLVQSLSNPIPSNLYLTAGARRVQPPHAGIRPAQGEGCGGWKGL